jgi:hypothetical protein
MTKKKKEEEEEEEEEEEGEEDMKTWRCRVLVFVLFESDVNVPATQYIHVTGTLLRGLFHVLNNLLKENEQ